MERERLPWVQRLMQDRDTRKMRNWQRLVIGERIRNKHGELSACKLLAPPRSAGKGSVSWVKVLCTGCNRSFERRLSTIIQGTSRRCQSCAARARSRKAKAATG